MTYDFEGRTEKEAIDKAAAELGLEKDRFDVEILETQRSSLFKKGFVRVRIHTDEQPPSSKERVGYDGESGESRPAAAKGPFGGALFGDPEAKDDFEKDLIAFVEGLIVRMGYSAKVVVLFREDKKLGLKIDSPNSSILIGKKGKNLDALQLLVNIYSGKLGRDDLRVILDSENYRIRREESLVRLAYSVAEKVRESRGSLLLEPMNPFERRLIHTTLNDISDIDTKSEGEGLYKQVRVFFRGSKR
ncbi:MAG: single-stranded DNA-binding protein [Treponema sp. GWB1_62_6]|nr:MAG: single-stranded DNA-binding protein [Treponema sp. GWB1_62_6]OHE77031.1 MAG: single-stranded DNA-binding protein [Treponema sp. RIFOXYC1_FULL_61_9]